MRHSIPLIAILCFCGFVVASDPGQDLGLATEFAVLVGFILAGLIVSLKFFKWE